MAFICFSTSPRKPTRRRHIFGSRSRKNATNAYSDCGLDKFEALVADLDEKRHKILAQKGCEDVSLVKFIYRSSSNEIEPIVIKLLDHRKHHNTSLLHTPKVDHLMKLSTIKQNNDGNEAKEDNTAPLVNDPRKKIRSDQCKRKIGEWRKSCYYFALFVIMILVLLMFSGRSLVILCTSIGWYLVPNVKEILHTSKKSNNITKKA
ncbi:uncharacterized protein LOC143539587 [Bidens hawaiensis]|uniref:uncharacterized protein LOC143539587 n=1 Tax=Bidens hawaiensis TaxID=980011 RepID=UPI00404AEDF4